MKISIRQKMRLFSHTPGASCLIPGTGEILRAFPTRLEVAGEVFGLPFTGPVRGFTLEQDLERGCVFIFGQAQEGYFRIRVTADDAGFIVKGEKGLSLEEKILKEMAFERQEKMERLSLGSHKQLNWDRIRADNDLRSWMPALYFLSQKTPEVAPLSYQIPSSWEALFLGLFEGILVPRFVDTEYQGLISEPAPKGDPVWILQEARKKIRGLFFKQNDRRLALLPELPSDLDQGRFVGLKVPGVGTLDLEWSKKLLRRAVLKADTSGEIVLELQKALHSYRVGGKKRSVDQPLLLEAGKTYLLDRFEK